MEKETSNLPQNNAMPYNTLLSVAVGQYVWVEPSKYDRGERNPIRSKVSKVGRKYFELEDYPNTKFRKDDGVEQNFINHKMTVYSDLQQILDNKEYDKLIGNLKNIFCGYGKLDCDLNTLRKIWDLLNNA